MNPEYVTKDSIFDILYCGFCNYSDETKQRLNDIIEQVRALSTADVVPVRHGKWIEKRWSTEDDWGVINWHSLTCSACGHEERTNGLSPNSIYKYDYCPHCEAKMDGESNG